TWNNGGKCLTLLDRSRAEAVSAARRVGETLMGSCKSWTVGGVARALLQWVGPPQPHRSCTDKALSGVPWSYRVCQPGTYENVALVDLKAAYHQGLARLPSIRLTWLPSGPVWHPMPAAERDRWNALLTAVAPAKPLRLVLLGNMVGGGQAPWCFCKGQRLAMKAQNGPFRSAGMAVVRAGYELCWLQAEEVQTVYANTDSVLMPRPARPRAWERWGYEWRLEAEGSADVRCLDVFRVGERMTAWYRQGSRFALALPATPSPPSLTLTAWH
ncbi:MAG: hypothetical protein ACRD1G_05725, partial [Acidimicrobiales bacterium]